MRKIILALILAASAAATPLFAQGQGKNKRSSDRWCEGLVRTTGNTINTIGDIILGTSNSAACENNVWYGHDKNRDGRTEGTLIRHRVDANGNVIVDRGRRGENGAIVLVNSKVQSKDARRSDRDREARGRDRDDDDRDRDRKKDRKKEKKDKKDKHNDRDGDRDDRN